MNSPDISERAFEAAIECALLLGGPDACPERPGTVRTHRDAYGEMPPGGFQRRTAEQYDRTLSLIREDVLAFIQGTQPKEWGRFTQHHGTSARDVFLKRLNSELAVRGLLDVLRKGVSDSGVKFKLAYFRPASGMNPEAARLHEANRFAVARQVKYSTKGEQSVDAVLFLNGIPLFTAEFKNPLTGQHVEDGIRQYLRDRDPRAPLLAPGRCLAHFVVDPDLVYVTTRLAGPATRFLPFNQGWNRGAGNPPASPTRGGYATSYLWEEIWARDSLLDLIRNFIVDLEPETNGNGRPAQQKELVFPRYHQIQAVRGLIRDAKAQGAGHRYLIQHSAGSGKSYTIGWLAHRLATLHNASDERVFDSIIVITDRRVLDRQLQRTLLQLEQTPGVVENIDTTSRQLKDALESGKTIIVTTLQKFPVIAEQIGELTGKRFAAIIDEAHSSQSGEGSRSLRMVLSADGLEEAEVDDAGELTPEDELDVMVEAAMAKRGQLPNLSLFAFTATPKQKTLELFGRKRDDGQFEPFHLYGMRQAIEEGFILDVLANYTTYSTYWRLLKRIEDDPKFDKRKAAALLKAFVDLHPHAIHEKLAIMVEHFATQIQGKIKGQAKAMIVTRSRLHAVRYKLAIDKYLAGKGYPFKALVAFSGSVNDSGRTYTEAGMNGMPESQTAATFGGPEHRFLIVANKFQTGFDQPLMHTMYVDKKLGGVNAVQTLSRLNRTCPGKDDTAVLDFANEAAEIKLAFEPYYEATLLSEATDPNLLYRLQGQLLDYGVYADAEVDAFAKLWFSGKATQAEIYAALAPLVPQFQELGPDERRDFRSMLADYVRQFAFLSQVLPFTDAGLEKLYQFGRHLRKLLPLDRERLPVEVQQSIDMESYRVQQRESGAIKLDRGRGVLKPIQIPDAGGPTAEEMEALSRIIAELNERFGMNLGPEHRLTLGQMLERLDQDSALEIAARVNTRENVRLTFDQKVESVIQDTLDSNFELYKRITNDRPFGDAVRNLLFDQYLRSHRSAEELIKRGESKTLEFKSSLRWNLRDDTQDDAVITHAVLKTIAAFLNTEGGDLLIGVADDGKVVGVDVDRLESDDKFMRHLAQAVRNGLGDRAGTCIDPRMQLVDGKTVCVVTCQRSPEPVYLKWRGQEKAPDGDFFVRNGPDTVRLQPASAAEYVRTRFVGASPP